MYSAQTPVKTSGLSVLALPGLGLLLRVAHI